MKRIGEIKEIESNIGKLIDESPFKREFFQKRYKKTPNTISNWCTGKSHPSTKELYDLAYLLEKKVDDLYEQVEEPPKRDLSNEPIELMNFEPRTFQALKKNKIYTYKDLKSCDLQSLWKVGKATIKDIEEKLEKWEKENEFEKAEE